DMISSSLSPSVILAQSVSEGRSVMRRREFITLVGSAALSWPLATRAQQPKNPVIGWLSLAVGQFVPLGAFRQGLAEAGYVEGWNVAIEFRSSSQYPPLSGLAADLVSREVAVIVTNGSPSAALAAKA